ncbi:hypothetical protein BBK36DRAFT_19803 [Trichoderma citrinoviride]|uniref:Metallo-beta-lactamase domain-containing protein n=1 Tax=Trichoderma citrinoviride TaxID=58853 RepID=A0A2T4B9V1_9HYPO|nr:hypothetical protein BBK36DRAFT_19803 [Trichoderma citrinoviride]PTB66094.1 hypothetical protein BBK36DRAFT_19803 [Trichoderma citrinoviride]
MSEQPKWLSAPHSAQTVRVRLIEEIGTLSLPSALFLDPVSEGHEVTSGPALAFLIENKTLGKMALFDLGIRKDWWNLPPNVRDSLAFCVGVKVEKGVPEVLRDAGISLQDIDDIIWSHSHLDHRGDVSLFPPTTTLHYGKKLAALKPESTGAAEAVFLASDFAGRPNKEVDFSDSTFTIGGFPALDFYGDGSFYLLDTPGHDHGHISALARTTSTAAGQEKDTFILLSGDACHFCGVLRPNASHPFPSREFPDNGVGLAGVERPEVLLMRHPQFPQFSDGRDLVNEAARTTAWYRVSKGQLSTFVDPVVGQATADRLREAFDEANNVFVALAHDTSLLVHVNGTPLLPTLNKAPQEDLNGWYLEGWKDRLYWTWTDQLGKTDGNGKVDAPKPLVVGFWMHGVKYDKVQEVIEHA